jgi:hypothetical protein
MRVFDTLPYGVTHLGEAEYPVPDVGTEASHRAIEGIAGSGIAGWIDGGELAYGCLPAANRGCDVRIVTDDISEFVVQVGD